MHPHFVNSIFQIDELDDTNAAWWISVEHTHTHREQWNLQNAFNTTSNHNKHVLFQSKQKLAHSISISDSMFFSIFFFLLCFRCFLFFMLFVAPVINLRACKDGMQSPSMETISMDLYISLSTSDKKKETKFGQSKKEKKKQKMPNNEIKIPNWFGASRDTFFEYNRHNTRRMRMTTEISLACVPSRYHNFRYLYVCLPNRMSMIAQKMATVTVRHVPKKKSKKTEEKKASI